MDFQAYHMLQECKSLNTRMLTIYSVGAVPHEYHHEEGVNEDVKFEHRKRVARVTVVPHEDLERHHS